MAFVIYLIALCLLVTIASGLDNGLVRTPPMGWLAWERYRCVIDCDTFPDDCISENLFKNMADRLAEDGWKDAGYNLINIDDCWASKKRDENNNLVADPKRFPSGIKALTDYVHSKGLKLGIYGDYGTLTCGGYPGSEGFEEQDANIFAKWGIDMLKFDGCYSNSSSQKIGYPLMSKMLNATGRPIIYSCSWPAYQGGLPPKVNYTELGEICNLWRNYGDIQDSWADVVDIANWWATNQNVLIPAAGPGRWNDPDMLLGGDFGLSYDETKSQFGIWAILTAPLFMSNNLRKIEPEIAEVLKDKIVIGINQDKLGIQGRRIKNENNLQLWTKPLVDDCHAVAVTSTRTDGFPAQYSFKLSELGFKTPAKSYILLEAFKKDMPQTLVKYNDSIHLEEVNPSGIRMFKACPHNNYHFKIQRNNFQML